MDEFRKQMAQVAASFQVLGMATEANTKEIQHLAEQVSRRNGEILHELQVLRGTFASIETHLVRLFEEDATTKQDVADLKRRVEALEHRERPPAA